MNEVSGREQRAQKPSRDTALWLGQQGRLLLRRVRRSEMRVSVEPIPIIAKLHAPAVIPE